MGLLTRRPEPEVAAVSPAAAADTPAPERRRWSRRAKQVTGDTEWTFGVSLATRAVHAGLLACLAAGPIALVAAAVGSQPAVVQAPPAAAVADTTGTVVKASAAAQRLVVAWLTASRTDEATLEAQLLEPASGVNLQLPAVRPASPGRVWLEDAAAVGGGRWLVTVGAQGGAAGAVSYYAVPVQVDAAGAVALTLPARTAAPTKPSPPHLDGSTDLAIGDSDPVSVTLQGYLTALVAGSGDLDRWTAPGAPVTAVDPAPCRSVQLQQVQAAADDLPVPTDGAQLAVVATATCTARGGAATVSQYPLLLRARGNRWEIAATNPALTAPDGAAPAPAVTVPPSSPSTPR